MEYRHEIINFGETIPVRCFIHQLGYSQRHWHDSLELLFVMAGSVTILVDGERFVLKEDDVILINSNSPHELNADKCLLAAVQIKLSLFDKNLFTVDNLFFECNSQKDPANPGLIEIKRIVARLVKTYATGGDSRIFRAKSLCYALLSELITYFKIACK